MSRLVPLGFRVLSVAARAEPSGPTRLARAVEPVLSVTGRPTLAAGWVAAGERVDTGPAAVQPASPALISANAKADRTR
jgi:hypothetical protein